MKPEGVKLRRANGSFLNCELVHIDPAPDGTDNWAIANAIYQAGDIVTVRVMPPGTTLTFHTAVDPDDIDITWDDDAD